MEDLPTPAVKSLPLHPDLFDEGKEEQPPLCPVAPSLVKPRNVNQILEHMQKLPYYEDQIKCIHIFPPKQAEYLSLTVPLPFSLWCALDSKYHFHKVAETIVAQAVSPSFSFLNAQQQQQQHHQQHQHPVHLYRHQTLGITALMQKERHHVVVSTGTSSGKSLIYNVPVLADILNNGGASTSLYIFPTKALAQDQKSSLQSLVRGVEEAGGRTVVIGKF